ncbi:Subtilisin-like protease 3 [Hondaea fermentalgiana]|uniref:subtilisin n=1 Tax=Hondaea fermentalgiana TaxID=2315210 RepID=A0A2R5GKY0_9STRA|nr:Subtilisin-like protease 3 [Hondaea fermentalgiana]|eukprot:GBG31562.1 Subtilisin-like protease 3 [Hondaea fermentalgiana]
MADSENTDLACAEVAELVKSWRQKKKALRAAQLYQSGQEEKDEDETLETTTVKSCFVFFSGTSALADYVSSLDKVIHVEEDTEVTIDDGSSSAPPSWGLDRIDQKDLPLSETPFNASYAGLGINIYVLDTGVNLAHEDFEGRAYAIQDFYPHEEDDPRGHGTHCAGIAAGKTFGVAPQATVLSIRIANERGRGYGSTTIRGVAAAVEYQRTRFAGESAVISLSISGVVSLAQNNACQEAIENGMIVVVAAGNSNENACLASPASAGGNGQNGGVITVGATQSDDKMAWFSSYGTCVDIFAPGRFINSTYIGSTTATDVRSGTSMSVPHVAGIAALLLEKHDKNNTLAQSELFDLAVADRLSGLEGEGTPNLLAQSPWGPRSPTAPTFAPTMPSMNEPNVVCADALCVDYAQSFYVGFPLSTTIVGQLVVAETNLCQTSDQMLSGKVVLVKYNGSCEQAEVALTMGAKAVIFRSKAKNGSITSSDSARPGVDIFSVTISYEDGKTFASLVEAKDGPVIARLGSTSFNNTLAPTPFPITPPSFAPTSAPTILCASLDGKKSKCKQRPECIWDQIYGRCNDIDPSLACGTLSKLACAKVANCTWAFLPLQNLEPACYDAVDVPRSTVLVTPSSCSKGSFASAEEVCENLGFVMCSGAQLFNADDDASSDCKINKKWVWSATSCGTKMYYQVKSGKSKIRCKRRGNKANARCCSPV